MKQWEGCICVIARSAKHDEAIREKGWIASTLPGFAMTEMRNVIARSEVKRNDEAIQKKET